MTDSINVEIPLPDEKPAEEISEIQQDVAELEGKVETLTEVVSEPPEIPEHEHAFHKEILDRLARVEETTDTLVKREVTRTMDEMHEDKAEEIAEQEAEKQEYTPNETTIATEEIVPEKSEETVIEPPPERSKRETPPGIWGFLKKAGF